MRTPTQPRQSRALTPRSSFTLIELLVVVSIIAVLAALLLPVLGKAKHYTKYTQCSGALKQVATAAFLYADDYDDWIPNAGGYDPSYSNAWKGKEIRWTGLMLPYFASGTGNQWKLPEDVRCAATSVKKTYWYGLNTAASNRRTPALKRPESTVWIGDTGAHWGEGDSYYLYPNRWRKTYIYRHFDEGGFHGKFNTVAADGHIETFTWALDDADAGGKQIKRPHENTRWFNNK